MNAPARTPDRTARPSLADRMQARPPLVIEGLPAALAALSANQVHVVYANPSPARDALFWKTAAGALRGPANVLSTRDDIEIAELLRSHGLDIDTVDAVHPKANLCTLRTLPDRDGTEVLIEALKALADQCAAPGSEFLIEGAEAFFTWHDAHALARQGAQLASWCAQNGFGVLLLIALHDDENAEASADGARAGSADLALAEFHARFAGAAQLIQSGGQYTWDVAFWRDRDTMLASDSLPLRFSPVDYRLMVASDTFSKSVDEAGLLAPDEKRVIVSRDAVLRERTLPQQWQVVDNNDAVMVAAAHAVAATVVLGYSESTHDSTQFEKLAEQVYTLRRRSGQALKIAVREDNVAMRYETVMRNLGVNLIIPRNTPIARVEAMLDGIQGQLFSRILPADYMSALSAVLHSTERGYVSAPRFVELVRPAIDRARSIHLPNVLLRLPLLAEVAHVDALQACQMRRDGDLCTACGDSIYTFFFACRLSDITAVLQRVFQLPPGELFRGELRCGDYDSISSMLESLELAIAEEPPLDYTSWLAEHPPPAAESGTPAAATPEEIGVTSTTASTTASTAETHAAGDEAMATVPADTPADTPDSSVTRRAAPKPAALPFKALG